jgi:hypothetical protein
MPSGIWLEVYYPRPKHNDLKAGVSDNDAQLFDSSITIKEVDPCRSEP